MTTQLVTLSSTLRQLLEGIPPEARLEAIGEILRTVADTEVAVDGADPVARELISKAKCAPTRLLAMMSSNPALRDQFTYNMVWDSYRVIGERQIERLRSRLRQKVTAIVNIESQQDDEGGYFDTMDMSLVTPDNEFNISYYNRDEMMEGVEDDVEAVQLLTKVIKDDRFTDDDLSALLAEAESDDGLSDESRERICEAIESFGLIAWETAEAACEMNNYGRLENNSFTFDPVLGLTN